MWLFVVRWKKSTATSPRETFFSHLDNEMRVSEWTKICLDEYFFFFFFFLPCSCWDSVHFFPPPRINTLGSWVWSIRSILSSFHRWNDAHRWQSTLPRLDLQKIERSRSLETATTLSMTSFFSLLVSIIYNVGTYLLVHSTTFCCKHNCVRSCFSS